MKNLLPIFLIFLLLILGCQKTPNVVLLDSQVPPENQLIKVSAEDLARDFAHGKKRSLLHDNDADKKYSGKWLKITGEVDSFSDQNDGSGYSIILKTFGGDPKVGCNGNRQENESPQPIQKRQQVTIVGKLVSSGNSSTLYLVPCKYVR